LKQNSCNGKFPGDPSMCTSPTRGSCGPNDYCVCNSGYFGSNCDISSCYGFNSTDDNVCGGNGECIDKDTCICDGGFSGAQCVAQQVDVALIILVSIIGFFLFVFITLVVIVIVSLLVERLRQVTKSRTRVTSPDPQDDAIDVNLLTKSNVNSSYTELTNDDNL
jgi:hypothetical protein